jgi:hypothetical protein
MLLFRGDLTADSGAIAHIDQVAGLSLDKQIKQHVTSDRHACQLVNRPCGARRYQPTQRNDRGVQISGRVAMSATTNLAIPVTVRFLSELTVDLKTGVFGRIL